MKRTLCIAAVTVGAAFVGATPALGKAKEPFNPGPNCHGQTIAFLAQTSPKPGIGNLAKSSQAGVTVQDIQSFIKASCAELSGQ